jgi:hypothetical protein
MSHGVSTAMAFAVRAQRDPRGIAGTLRMGEFAKGGPLYVGLLLLILGALGAASGGDLWGKPWIIASIVVFVVVIVAMYAIATPYYGGLRKALEPVDAEGRPTIDAAALAPMLDNRRPEALAAVGFAGLLILFWLMVLKPG